MNNRVRFMYIRDAKWSPVGCLAIVINRSKNCVSYGLSMRNPKDAVNQFNKSIKFDRKLAQQLATEDLYNPANNKRAYVHDHADMKQITMSVMGDIVARRTAPSKAVRFAKHWLGVDSMLRELDRNLGF